MTFDCLVFIGFFGFSAFFGHFRAVSRHFVSFRVDLQVFASLEVVPLFPW